MLAQLCHVCGCDSLQIIPDCQKLQCVTSDCRPSNIKLDLALCKECNILQKNVDENWIRNVQEIFESYDIYSQSSGVEHTIYDKNTDKMVPRSQLLVNRLSSYMKFPKNGQLLDVGCGNGAFLFAFNNVAPDWSLAGFELTEKNRVKIEQVNGVKKFYTGSVVDIPEEFDVVSIMHVLSHIPNPLKLLEICWKKLTPDGLLLLQLPAWQKSPIDLLVADHCTHFTEEGIRRLLNKIGFEVELSTMDIIQKEITIVARKKTNMPVKTSLESDENVFQLAVKSVEWLISTKKQAEEISNQAKQFGIFGTSLAATWIYNEIGNSIKFFVDEDSNRVGKDFLGSPVYFPKEAPAGSEVIILLPIEIAEQIKLKLEKIYNHFKFYLPPKMSLA